ncbi:MAG: hypothetical protein CMD67_03850 [Gammaproteobacteria bacterium]|nr:hypothetical protein [Gammaproteobacteria bacterium]
MVGRVICKGVMEPEGPVCLSDGQVYLVEMAKNRACVSLVDLKGHRHEIGRPGGRPNGLTIDGNGNLWIAGGENEALVCMSPNGEVLSTFFGPKNDPYLWPNDLAFGPNGLLYMTDSGILPDDFIDGQSIRNDYKSCPFNGRVFEIDPINGSILRILDNGLKFTNGIAFDSQDKLYVNETITGNVYCYDIFSNTTPTKTLFGNVIDGIPESFVGPDGMAFGLDGLLYCAVFGQGNITVLDTHGDVVDRIKTNGQTPTNIAFLEHEDHGAVVTDLGKCELEELNLPCGGQPLHKPLI